MNEDITKTYHHRLCHLKIMATFLQLVPFLRCVILNGSMAEGRIKFSSDIDILIIAKRGRIFTARFLALLLAKLLGKKRSSDEKKPHNGKFCFNYFLTDNFLIIPHHRDPLTNEYCAKNYSKSVLVWGDQKLFEKFMRINLKWMKKYQISKCSPSFSLSEKKHAKAWATTILSEKILSNRFGDIVELGLKNIQLKKINRDPRTKRYPTFIVANDREMRFHLPRGNNKPKRS